MFARALTFAMFLGGVLPAAQPTSPLPPEWLGTWTGKLAISSAADKQSEVAVALKIEPIKGTRELTWAITYGEGARAMVRDYKLVPDGDKPGRFKIDERNGIALDARLVNGVMYSQFKVGDAMLTARYELRGDTLRFEITSAKAVADNTGKGSVQGFAVDVIQAAELKRN
jgi:hypothetical protein